MSNSSSNRSSFSSKRPAFVTADVLKDFGCVKKPRLDVRLTPVSQCSPKKSVSVVDKDNEDELWGEDLPAEAVEECVLLATQACREDQIVGSVSTFPQNLNEPSTSRNCNGFSKPSSYFLHPGPSNVVFQHKKEVVKPILARQELLNGYNSSITLTKPPLLKRNNENPNIFSEKSTKLENENKELKEKCLEKEGEVAILRAQLKKLELQIKTQTVDHRKSLEDQAQKYTKQINEHKKELEVTNTQLQFQIMETTSVRNHCRVLESSSKIKLVEPQPAKAVTPKRKKDEDGTQILKSSNQTSPVSGATKSSIVTTTNEIVQRNLSNQIFRIREGSVLGQLVNEYLTLKSHPDISWILYLRKKQSLCKKIKEADGINEKILALQRSNVTLENCYAAVNKLITLDAISSTSANLHVESIVRDCQRIICREMHIQCMISAVQSFTERGNLNGAISSDIGKSVGSSCELMASTKWYEEEEGIESRRAIGLLCALCSVSGLASMLTYGSENLASSSNITGVESSNITAVETNQDTATTSKMVRTTNAKETHPDIIFKSRKNDDISYDEYLTKPFGFLELLRNMLFAVCYQKRTKNFIGFLTGALKLLSAIGRNIKLADGGLGLISEIIREVVFCRPQVEVIVAVFELLSILASYPSVMKSLCVNSDEKAFIDNRDIGLAYFTRQSCVAQVLMRLLPVSVTTLELRTELCYHMVHWLYSTICFYGNKQCWLVSFQENKNPSCCCRRSIASGLLTTLYDSLCDWDTPNLDHGIKWKLQGTFKKSIILLRAWQEDKTSWAFFNRHNCAYQLWLGKMEMDLPKLNLNNLERECVKELLDKPVNENDTNSSIGNEDIEYWNIISNSSKNMLADLR